MTIDKVFRDNSPYETNVIHVHSGSDEPDPLVNTDELLWFFDENRYFDRDHNPLYSPIPLIKVNGETFFASKYAARSR